MMESRENTVKAKEEPNDTWPNTDDGYFDLVDSCEVKKGETFIFHKPSANAINEAMSFQKKVDEKIFIDFQSKYVKPELKSLSRTMCKTEYQNFLPTVKIENQVKKNFSNEKRLVILIKKEFNSTSHLKTHITAVHIWSKPFDCDICHKSFGEKGYLKAHITAVHDRINPFKCDVCHKSFGHKSDLKKHINTLHNRFKPFKCDICHKSFGEKGNLKKHINTVHIRNKNEICHFVNLPHMPTHPALIYNAK
uniref:C2H2-type domain-containing protein n=1 Tax=Trichogramma kaykai TaxID=54128 RepID=A0ABD2W749_9HYME